MATTDAGYAYAQASAALERRSKGSLLSIAAIAVLAVCAGWLVLDRWVLARSPEPVPGIRGTTWKRVRDMPKQVNGLTTIRGGQAKQAAVRE